MSPGESVVIVGPAERIIGADLAARASHAAVISAIILLLGGGCATHLTAPADGYAVYFDNGSAYGIFGSAAACDRQREREMAERVPAFAHRYGITQDEARQLFERHMSTCRRTSVAPSPPDAATHWIYLEGREWLGAATEKDCRALTLKPCEPVRLERQ